MAKERTHGYEAREEKWKDYRPIREACTIRKCQREGCNADILNVPDYLAPFVTLCKVHGEPERKKRGK
jgi:hypothetical protein